MEIKSQLAVARRRLAEIQDQYDEARRQLEIETVLVRQLEWRLTAGIGHSWTEDLDPSAYWPSATPATRCRHCRAAICSDAGEQPCPGDQNQCPHVLTDGELSPAARLVYAVDGELCGRPGVFTEDFSAWFCGAGHRTSEPHHPCRIPDCPCPALINRR